MGISWVRQYGGNDDSSLQRCKNGHGVLSAKNKDSVDEGVNCNILCCN